MGQFGKTQLHKNHYFGRHRTGRIEKERFFSVLFMLFLCCTVLLSGCGAHQGSANQDRESVNSAVSWTELERKGPTDTWEMAYATQYSVTEYDGYRLVTIADGQRILLVPEGLDIPADVPEDMTVMALPLQNVYVAASSAMDFFRQLDVLPRVAFTSTTYENWAIPEVREALDAKTMTYAGKYSAPDYELVLNSKCNGVVESTMIYHSPETLEQLRKLGLPVLVERSSYETHPMGRLEWIRLYGLLMGQSEQAEIFFDKASEQFRQVLQEDNTGKTVVFFYINNSGIANVRKPGDYLAKMIELAGGNYVFADLPVDSESATSSMNMEMESFYAGARDADYMIYSSTIDGELDNLNQLLAKSNLLADFKAVKEGNVWCTEKNLFQETTATADMILDFHQIVTGEADEMEELRFLYRLR